MKPTLTSPERLVFTTRPTFAAAIAGLATIVFTALAVVVFRNGNDAGVIFLIFALSGPVYAWFFLETREVAFEWVTASVTVTRRGARGTTAQVYPLAGLVGAAVRQPGPTVEARAVDPEVRPRPAGPFRPVLVYQDGHEVPLDDGFHRGTAAFDMVRAINTWLADG